MLLLILRTKKQPKKGGAGGIARGAPEAPTGPVCPPLAYATEFDTSFSAEERQKGFKERFPRWSHCSTKKSS